MGDIVFGIEKGGREILVGVLILAVYLYGAVGLSERLAGYIMLLLGGLASAALPVVHTMGGPSQIAITAIGWRNGEREVQ